MQSTLRDRGHVSGEKFAGSTMRSTSAYESSWQLQLLDTLLRNPYKHMSQLADKIKQDTGIVDSEKVTDIILQYVLLGDFFCRSFREGKLMDATVDIGKNYSFDAHSIILAAHSEFFYHHILSTDQGDDDIFLEDMHPDTFKHVLEYMYTGQILINVSNIIDLYHLGDQLKVHTLRDTCINYVKGVSPEDALIINDRARKANLENITQLSHDIVVNRFSDVVKSKNFLYMDLSSLIRLLNDNDIIVKSEMVVFDAALQWLKYDLDARRDHGTQVLASVRFQFIKPNELVSCMDVIRNLLGNAASEQIVMGASWYHTCQLLGKDSIIDEDIQPRKCLQFRMSEAETSTSNRGDYMSREGNSMTDVTTVNMPDHPTSVHKKGVIRSTSAQQSNSSKRPLTPIPPPAMAASAVGTPQMISATPLLDDLTTPSAASAGVLGSGAIGQREGAELKLGGFSVPPFDLGGGDSKNWQFISTMPAKRCKHAVAIAEGSLYIIGGHDGVTATNTVFKFDVRLNKWLEMSPMIKKRINAQTTVMNGYLYVVGGQDEEGRILASFERYNIRANTWHKLSTARIARVGAAMAAYKGQVVIAGGYSFNKNKKVVILDAVEAWNPEDGTWSLRTKLRFPRYHSVMAELKGRLFICGGVVISSQKGNPTPISIGIIDSYDSVRDEWQREADLKLARHKPGVSILDNKLYIMGGINLSISATSGKNLTSIECYDVEERSWQIAKELPPAQPGLVCVSLPVNETMITTKSY